jgi:hypothetical protein
MRKHVNDTIAKKDAERKKRYISNGAKNLKQYN